jgi:MFS transporter, MHS family, proline/betaine transporter
MDEESLYVYGWRVPFLLSPLIGLVSLYLLHHLEDGDEFSQAAKLEEEDKHEDSSQKMKEVLKNYYVEIIMLVCSLATWSPMVFALFIWLPFYLTDMVGIKEDSYNPFVLNLSMLVLFCILCPVFGNLIDLIGKRTGNPNCHRYFLVFSSTLTMVLLIPAYLLLQQHSVICAISGSLCLLIPLAIYGSTMFVFCVEQFAVQDRLTGVGYAYNLSHCVWASSITSFLTLLADDQSLTAPAFYMVALNAISILAGTYGFEYVNKRRCVKYPELWGERGLKSLDL